MDKFIKVIGADKQRFLNVAVVGFISLIMPGQNDLQTLNLIPGVAATREVNVDIPVLGKVPVLKDGVKKPYLVAEAAIVLDRDSGAVLYEKNIDKQLMPASTTKIMTTLVALDEYKLDDIVTITDADQSIGHKAEIVSGELLTVESLLKAMMIPSGNDAALALAEHHPQGYNHFVALMNKKAEEYHLTNTHYQNVSGVETYQHYSSALDLAILTKEAMKIPKFSEIVGTKRTVISSVDDKYVHELVNLNELLGYIPGVVGVKTGWTEHAGECLVTYTVRGEKAIIAVVLNSSDRFGESARLLEWVFANYEWK